MYYQDDVYIRLIRPEGYEDIAPELVIEDAIHGNTEAFQPENVTEYVNDLYNTLARLVYEIDLQSPWRLWSEEKLKAWEDARKLTSYMAIREYSIRSR